VTCGPEIEMLANFPLLLQHPDHDPQKLVERVTDPARILEWARDVQHALSPPPCMLSPSQRLDGAYFGTQPRLERRRTREDQVASYRSKLGQKRR
jgi:hypothetical protein